MDGQKLRREPRSTGFWRLIALLVAVTMSWVAWVAWQISPRPLVTDLAYQVHTKMPRPVATTPQTSANAKARKLSKQPSWAQVLPEQQNLLRPLEGQWDHLSDLERKRLLAAAKRYPTMSKQKQERYASRLLQWSKMTIEQRNQARKRYAEYSKIRKESRLAIENKWKEEQATSTPAPQEKENPKAAIPSSPLVDAASMDRTQTGIQTH